MMKKSLLMIILVIVIGCSPSERSIEKAVKRGDYQYIENYLSNSEYWYDPKKIDINAAAVEGLILLNRIDSAVALYNKTNSKPLVEMMIKAFANALVKSKPQKIPEEIVKIAEVGHLDDLLRKTIVEIEPTIGASKIKSYVEKAINDRQTLKNRDAVYKESLSKALLWDAKSIFAESLNLLMQQYSELENIASKLSDAKNNLENKKQELELKRKYEREVEGRQRFINELRSGNPSSSYYLAVQGCIQVGAIKASLWGGSPYSHCLEMSQRDLERVVDNLNKSKEKFEKAIIQVKNIENTGVEIQSQMKAKVIEVEELEAQLLESLKSASGG